VATPEGFGKDSPRMPTHHLPRGRPASPLVAAPVEIHLKLTGPVAAEVRRVCDNLDIGLTTFVRKAIKGELRAMGIIVE